MLNEQSQASSRALDASEKLTNLVMTSYADARRGVKRDLEKLLSVDLEGLPPHKWHDYLIKRGRLSKLLKSIDRNYLNYAASADRRTREAVRVALNESFARYQYVLKYFSPVDLGVGLNFMSLPIPLAEVIVEGNLKQFNALSRKGKSRIQKNFGPVRRYVPQAGTLTNLLSNNQQVSVDAINRAITSGILQGKGAKDISRAVSDAIGDERKGAAYRALRIARSETLRASNDGAYAAMENIEALGVGQQKMWSSTLDLRTRDSHQSLDGQLRDLPDNFEGSSGSGLRPGAMGSASENVNCRCRIVSVFDGVRPQIRRGRNPKTGKSELFRWKDYEAWKTSS